MDPAPALLHKEICVGSLYSYLFIQIQNMNVVNSKMDKNIQVYGVILQLKA